MDVAVALEQPLDEMAADEAPVAPVTKYVIALLSQWIQASEQSL